MNTPRHPAPDVLAIDRPEAARLLRAARAAPLAGGDEAVDWAFASLPDSRPARRMKVETLLRDHDVEAADALIAQGLLQHPTDPALALLHARSLLIQNDPARAEREVRLVLERRPNHVASLIVGAAIARARRDYPLAIERLEIAWREGRRVQRVQRTMIEVLLEAGQPERAERLLETLTDAAPVLRARLLESQGRILEAVELLETARSSPPAGRDVAVPLIDLLERAGHFDRLHTLLEEIPMDDTATIARAGRSWLLLGAFTTALERLEPIRHVGPHRREALGVSVVAEAMLGHADRAETLLARLQQASAGVEPGFMAELWRRGLTGRVIFRRFEASPVTATAGRTLLSALAQSALEVFNGARPSRSAKRRADLERHRSVCLAVLGRPNEAVDAFEDSRVATAELHSSSAGTVIRWRSPAAARLETAAVETPRGLEAWGQGVAGTERADRGRARSGP